MEKEWLVEPRGDWETLPTKARQAGELRIWEERFEGYLYFNPSDSLAWRVCAELFLEDACYANALWILRNRVETPKVPGVETMERLAMGRANLLHGPGWAGPSGVPDSARYDALLDKWMGMVNFWEARSECLAMLAQEPFEGRLWLSLGQIYYVAEEALMGVWCALTVLANIQEREGCLCAWITRSLRSAGVYGVQSPWEELVQRVAEIDVEEVVLVPAAKRVEVILRAFRGCRWLEPSSRPSDPSAALSPPPCGWRNSN